MAMESEGEDIAGRLVRAAVDRASTLGAGFAPDGIEAIRQVAAQSVGKINERAQSERTPVELQITTAETSFRRLADAMIEVAGRPTQNLNSQNFQAALLRICPIWPICK
jgi:hypothetical protein